MKMMAAKYGHSNAAFTIRTSTTSSQITSAAPTSVDNVGGGFAGSGLMVYGSSEMASGSSTGRNSVKTPKNAVMVCTKRSRLFTSAKATWNHTSATTVSSRNSTDNLDGAVAMSEVMIADTAKFTAITMASRLADAGRLSGPARNKMMSMRRANNTRRFTSIMPARLYTSP